MMFWGSAVDPSKAKVYELPLLDTLLPPTDKSNIPTVTSSSPPSTKTHSKPTAHLSDGHGTVEGENSKPAFPTGQKDTARPTESSLTSSTPTPDEGWFSDMSNLLSSQKWFFGAIGAVVLFGFCAGIFFWRRRSARLRRANYTSIPAGDELPMSAIRDGLPAPGGGPRTKELYDAFGEVSDDEDADEETRLRGVHPQDQSPGRLRFHSGFLDDDEPPSTGGAALKYKDEPEDEPREGQRHSPEDRATSPSVSGDGSWEHAS